MKWNWAYLFEKLPFSFDELVKDIESAGLMLCNPSSMRITRLTANGLPLDPGKPGSGNQIPSSQSELGSLIYSGHEVPFQWWLDPSRDIFCSIQKISDELLAELYDLGGLTDEEGITLYASLLRRFSRGVAKSSSVGLVFDPKGANEDFDWKEFLLCSK